MQIKCNALSKHILWFNTQLILNEIKRNALLLSILYRKYILFFKNQSCIVVGCLWVLLLLIHASFNKHFVAINHTKTKDQCIIIVKHFNRTWPHDIISLVIIVITRLLHISLVMTGIGIHSKGIFLLVFKLLIILSFDPKHFEK